MLLSDKIKWVGTAITLIGAVLASLDIYPYSAIFLNLVAFTFLIWAILIREPAMIAVNSGLLAIYTLGLAYKFLINQ